MNMKLSQLALAVSASLVIAPGFAASGSALTTIYPTLPAANLVYISGASALSSSLASVVAANCLNGLIGNAINPAVVHAYDLVNTVATVHVAGGGSTSDGRVVVCTTKSIAGGQFTVPFAVIKRDTNGSFDGVGPVISQVNLLKWADVKNQQTGGGGCDLATKHCVLNDVTPIKPHAGLTDVNYEVWKGLSNTNTLNDVNGAAIPVPNIGSTQKFGGFAGQGFGVMVSESLYAKMRSKQATEGRLPGCNPAADPTYLPGVCQPSISKEEYTAIVDSSTYAYVSNGALSGDNFPVNLCRRVSTSGTQAASNVYFLNNSCNAANPTVGFKFPKVAGDSGNLAIFDTANGDNVTGHWDNDGTFGVFEGSGTGDARNCVIRRNAGRNPNNFGTGNGVGTDGLGTYAIGWISLENAPAAGWKLIKLDGISPNAYQTPVNSAADIAGGGAADGWVQDAQQRNNVVESYYDAAPELEMLWPAVTPFNPFLTALKNTFGNPNQVNTRGVFQANNASAGYTHAAFHTQVHKGTRFGNFCAPQTLLE